MKDDLVVVTGAGGFIAGHLVAQLRRQGYRRIRAVDIKPLDEWYQGFGDVENLCLDLNLRDNCTQAVKGAREVYNLAANMGGMGFIEKNKALCMLSVLINTHMLLGRPGVRRPALLLFLIGLRLQRRKAEGHQFSGPQGRGRLPGPGRGRLRMGEAVQRTDVPPLPRGFRSRTRVARFHNVYGPHGTWDGGREKAPAAMCRKVIQAKISGRMEIEIWGTGERTRSFMYIDDCLDGIGRIMHSDIREPINLGSSELVSVNQLVDMVEEIAGVKLKRIYDPSAPQGVAGRNSDNTLIRKYLEWEPSTPLREGLARTYAWIYDQYRKRERGEATTV